MAATARRARAGAGGGSEARLVNKRTLGRRRSAGTARTEQAPRRAKIRQTSPRRFPPRPPRRRPRFAAGLQDATTTGGDRVARRPRNALGRRALCGTEGPRTPVSPVPRLTRLIRPPVSLSPLRFSGSRLAATASVPATTASAEESYRDFVPVERAVPRVSARTKTSPPVNTDANENAPSSEVLLTAAGKPSSVSLPARRRLRRFCRVVVVHRRQQLVVVRVGIRRPREASRRPRSSSARAS